MKKFILSLAVVVASVMAGPARSADIVDTAVGAGSFKTLVAAVKAAGLVETLKGDGPFTVFAPTDEAFAKIPSSTLGELLKPENKAKLQSILTYHVVPGKVLAGDVLNVAEAGTVQGSPAKFGLTIQGANIIKTDIVCDNGVIHVIDAVIMPPTKKMPTNVQAVSHSPRRMIETAIAEGSHLYNSGHPCECANLYTKTMTTLWKVETMPAGLRTHINDTLESANHTASSDQRAWVLRRGLDSLYRSL